MSHYRLEIYRRQREHLKQIPRLKGWMSSRLGIRFVVMQDALDIYHPDGQPFLSSVELARLKKAAEERVEQEAARAERLGVDPDDLEQ